MVFDSIVRLGKYIQLHPHFSLIVQYLKDIDLNTLKEGKHQITEEISVGKTKYGTKNESFIECHRKYIDIQMVLSGKEQIGFCDIDQCEKELYDIEKDLQKLKGNVNFLTLEPGYFVILYPEDGHMPCLMTNKGSEEVVKIVFKIPVLGD